MSTSATPTALAQPAGSSDFVQRQATQLTVGGRPLRWLGVNLYYASGDPSIYQCGPRPADAALDEWFGRIRTETDSNVIRFWAFQSYTAGATDWRGIDRVIAQARLHGLRVLPVLENQWDACTNSGYKWSSWYRGAVPMT